MPTISFSGRHFKRELILQSVRWYLSYALSYRDIEELMLERGIEVDHSTINRWIIHYAPQLEKEFRKKKRKPGDRWRLDARVTGRTYIKVKGVMDILLQSRRPRTGQPLIFCSLQNVTSATLRFIRKAIGSSGQPSLINIDKSGTNTAAIKQYNNVIQHKSKYDNVKNR